MQVPEVTFLVSGSNSAGAGPESVSGGSSSEKTGPREQ